MAFALPAYASIATVEQIQGEVYVHRASDASDAWQAINQNIPLEEGDSLKTANGSCVLVYTDQATFKLEGNTSITVRNTVKSKDIQLLLGQLRAKVNKGKVTEPFQVVTPVAVGAVRGTDVDFGLNAANQLAVDLQNGNVQVFNTALDVDFALEGSKSIKVSYDSQTGALTLTNVCTSQGSVTFTAGGQTYNAPPCESVTVILAPETAGQQGIPGDDSRDDGEPTPNENPEPPTIIPPPISESGDTGGGDQGGNGTLD